MERKFAQSGGAPAILSSRRGWSVRWSIELRPAVIYTVEKDVLIIVVVTIGHRLEVYRPERAVGIEARPAVGGESPSDP